jgi:hypothetical protein
MAERSEDPDISKRILLAWGEQKPPTQIAMELRRTLKFVMQTLKREQKKIVERGGPDDGGENKG